MLTGGQLTLSFLGSCSIPTLKVTQCHHKNISHFISHKMTVVMWSIHGQSTVNGSNGCFCEYLHASQYINCQSKMLIMLVVILFLCLFNH